MTTTERLDVDPKNLEFDFNPDWQKFRESRLKKFLVCWLESRTHLEHLALEACAPAELGKHQGALVELKKFTALLNKESAGEELKQTITYLENHG